MPRVNRNRQLSMDDSGSSDVDEVQDDLPAPTRSHVDIQGIRDECKLDIDDMKESHKLFRKLALEIGLDLIELCESMSEDQALSEIEEFKKLIDQVTDEERKTEAAAQALYETTSQMGTCGTEINPTEVFHTAFAKSKAKNQSKPKEQVDFDELFTILEELMPSCRKSRKSDMVVVGSRLSFKCPITGAQMIHPVKNRICRHTYDRDGVKAVIQQRGDRVKCPVVGCQNKETITEQDLVDDIIIRRLMEKREMQNLDD